MTDLLDHAFITNQKNQDSQRKIKNILKKAFPNIIFPETNSYFSRSKNCICIFILPNVENLQGKFCIQVADMTNSLIFDFSFLSQLAQPIRIKSQYQKCSLMKKFAKKNQNEKLGAWQINPLNGQVRFMISTFINFSQKKLLSFETKIEETVINIKKAFFSHSQTIKLIYSYHKVFQSEVNTKNAQNSYQQRQNLIQSNGPLRNSSSYAQFLKYCTKQFEFSKFLNSQKQQQLQQQQQQQKTNKSTFKEIFTKQKPQNIPNPEKEAIIKDFEQHFILEKNSVNFQSNKNFYGDLKKRSFAKNINEYMQILESSFFKPVTNQMKNYQKLMLTKKNQQELSSEIGLMRIRKKSSSIIKVKDQVFGNLRIQIKQSGNDIASRINYFMKGLPIYGREVGFFDNYFKFQQKFSEGLTITLALNKQNAVKFLQANSHCMSFETKMKIFSQIISCSYLLWKKMDTIMPNISISAFSITKSINLKLDSQNYLAYLKKYDKQEKEQKKRQIELKLVESNLNIARIFLTIFYDYHMMYFRSNYKCQRSLRYLKEHNRFSKILIQKIQNNTQIFGPFNQMRTLLYIVLQIVKEAQKDWKSMRHHDIKWMICKIIKILQHTTK